ncbi:hypothetical protein OROGR_004121 [Orobanche gracilis]
MENNCYQIVIGGKTIATTFSTNPLRDFAVWFESTSVRGGVIGFSARRMTRTRRSAMHYGEADLPFPICLMTLCIGNHSLVARIFIHTWCSNTQCFLEEERRFLINHAFMFCGMSVEDDLDWLCNHFRIAGGSICLDLAVAAVNQQCMPAPASLQNMVQNLLHVEVDWPIVGEDASWMGDLTGAQIEYITMEAFFVAAVGDLLMAAYVRLSE